MSSDRLDDARQPRLDQEDLPGDPACWLRRVCPNCGTLADADPPTICEQCKQEIPAQ